MKFCYVQSQGNVFLVDDNGTLRLPKPEEVPFAVKKVTTMKLNGHEVDWCDSKTYKGEGWVYRDDILTSDIKVDGLAKLAAIKSYPRVTAAAFLIKDGKVLLVKPNRGMAKGKWIAPGGFVEYDESPEETARKEVMEETGLRAGKLELLSVETWKYDSSNYHFVTVFFTGGASGKVRRRTDEIGEIMFVPVAEAADLTDEENNRTALKKLAERIR